MLVTSPSSAYQASVIYTPALAPAASSTAASGSQSRQAGAPGGKTPGLEASASVEISPEARQKSQEANENKTGLPGQQELTETQEKQVRELKSTDQKVRAHEQAHLSAAGGLARSGASFSYETGPDGKRYAVGGEVNIDTSPVPDDPEATIAKANRIRAAALAPADPSPQDHQVAAAATKMAMQARSELAATNTGSGGQSQAATGTKVNFQI